MLRVTESYSIVQIEFGVQGTNYLLFSHGDYHTKTIYNPVRIWYIFIVRVIQLGYWYKCTLDKLLKLSELKVTLRLLGDGCWVTGIGGNASYFSEGSLSGWEKNEKDNYSHENNFTLRKFTFVGDKCKIPWGGDWPYICYLEIGTICSLVGNSVSSLTNYGENTVNSTIIHHLF